MKIMIRNFLNNLGLYTFEQYVGRVEQADAISAYARDLERIVDRLPDPAKPIIIYGKNVSLHNIKLLRGQQIIVSPYAECVSLTGIIASGEAAT